MPKFHPENERMKHKYLAWLKEAQGKSENTLDQVAAAISLFEKCNGYRDFKRFHIEQARKFKRWLAEQRHPKTGKPLSKATIHARLMAVKAFFKWLADQPGYKSRISHADTEYFNLTENDVRVAQTRRSRPVPSMEQILHALRQMPTETPLQRRNRALIAFTLLSGARDAAIASMSLRHVDVDRRLIIQDARQVRTKRAKTIVSTFFPVGDEVEKIVIDWIRELKEDHLFGPDDPLFPATEMGLNEAGHFQPLGLSRKHWSDAGPIRRISKEAFTNAGLPAFNPHSFRHTLVRLGEKVCRTPEEFKAWSQNLGHDRVMTTFTSYGEVPQHRQAEIISSLRHADEDPTREELELLRKLKASMSG